MLSNQELILVAGFAALVVALAVFASRFAARSEETLRERQAERDSEAAQVSPPRPVRSGSSRKGRRKR